MWVLALATVIQNFKCLLLFYLRTKYQVWVCVFLVGTKGTFWYQNCLTLLTFFASLIYL